MSTDPFDAIADRLDRLGIPRRDPKEIQGAFVRAGDGRHYAITDLLDRLITVIEKVEGWRR